MSLIPPKIYSHSWFDFISSIQTSWLVEGSQPTDPLILLVLQTLTFTAPVLGTTHMPHSSQHLLRCVDVVHQGEGQVVEVTMLLVCWAPIMEMFVEACICFLSSDCTFSQAPSVANIAATSHINELTCFIFDDINKPLHRLLCRSRSMDIPPCKPMIMTLPPRWCK